MSFKLDFFLKLAMFAREHMCWSLFSIKLQVFRSLRTPFSQSNSGRLLLQTLSSLGYSWFFTLVWPAMFELLVLSFSTQYNKNQVLYCVDHKYMAELAVCHSKTVASVQNEVEGTLTVHYHFFWGITIPPSFNNNSECRAVFKFYLYQTLFLTFLLQQSGSRSLKGTVIQIT